MNVLKKIPDTIQDYIDKDLIRVQKHPTEDIFIYNYTSGCQIQGAWDDVTLQCRGLIADKDGNIVARPFPKFFNLSEYEREGMSKDLFTPEFEIAEKFDGSLGIMYWIDDLPYIATRGSFTTEQAIHATNLLRSKYSDVAWLKGVTYLFEIIYPANRIVVDYRGMDELVLLGEIDTGTAIELDISGFPFPTKAMYRKPPKTLDELGDYEVENKEGFVVRFTSGLKVKYKFEEYKRLHKIVTEVNSKNIWEALMHGHDITEYLEKVPDEFYSWVISTKESLLSEHQKIKNAVEKRMEDIKSELEENYTQKQFAHLAKKSKYSGLLFCLHAGKEIDSQIWKMIKPKAEKPFATNE